MPQTRFMRPECGSMTGVDMEMRDVCYADFGEFGSRELFAGSRARGHGLPERPR